MNKTQIIKSLSNKTGSSKAEAKRNLDALIHIISDTLQNGNNVRLTGFGTFSVIETKARTGRNPKTGEPLKIKPKKRVRFKPGADLSSQI